VRERRLRYNENVIALGSSPGAMFTPTSRHQDGTPIVFARSSPARHFLDGTYGDDDNTLCVTPGATYRSTTKRGA